MKTGYYRYWRKTRNGVSLGKPGGRRSGGHWTPEVVRVATRSCELT